MIDLALALLAAQGFPHIVVLTKGGAVPERPGMCSTFTTDRGCCHQMLNTSGAALETYIENGFPLIFAFHARKDLKILKSRLGTFERRGYRVLRTEGPEGGRAAA
jgi:hypothetical protein